MQSVSANRSGCARLHRQTSTGRERRCCGGLAGHLGSSSAPLQAATACASRKLSRFIAASDFAHGCGRSAPRNRSKLRSQSTSGRFAIIKKVMPNKTRSEGKSSECDEFPVYFSVCDFKPRHAGRCALVRACHTTRIQKQNTSTPFVSRDVRVSV
jgi:hypothetical protein